MLFKDISYLELWLPFCSEQPNHLSNFSRGHYEEHFSEMILNLDQWLRRRCHLKTVLIKSSGGTFAQWRGHICPALDQGVMRNISMKLY